MKPKFTIKLPEWNQHIEVYVGNPEATQAYLESKINRKWWKARQLSESMGMTHRLVNKENKSEFAFVMWFSELNNDIEGLKVISHEVTHITHAVLKFVGCEPNFSNEEPEAYLHEYIFGEIIKHI